MKFIQKDLTVFDYDPRLLRGCNFFEREFSYWKSTLEANRDRILPRSKFRCILCGHSEGDTIIEWQDAYQIIRCDRCDLSTANFAFQDIGQHITRSYDNKNYYKEKFLPSIVAQWDYRKQTMGKDRFEYIFERLNIEPASTKLLDVGCGAGYVISYLADKGVACRGLEVDPMATRFCQDHGLDVVNGDIAAEPDGTYDVVTMFDVIEHVGNPLVTAKEAIAKLKPGGYLVAYTPNISSVGFELMAESQNLLKPFEHTCFFSTGSVEYLALHAGFELHSLDTFGFDVMDYLLLKEHQEGHQYTKTLRDLMLLTQACVDKLGVANHMRLTLRKPD